MGKKTTMYNLIKVRDMSNGMIILLKDEELFAIIIAELIRTNNMSNLILSSGPGISLKVEHIVILRDIHVDHTGLNLYFDMELYSPYKYGNREHKMEDSIPLVTNVLNGDIETAAFIKASHYFD